MSIRDMGYNGFLIRQIPSSRKLTPLETRNQNQPGSLTPYSMNAALNPATDISFSSTDNDTAAWTSGTIYFADGTNSGHIVAGNTGNITGTTYVYYDKQESGSLQTTDSAENATGSNRVMMAIVDQGASGKDCKIVTALGSGLTVSGITASQIAANTITASEITSGTITATEISGSQLDVVAANTGTLDVDEHMTVGGDSNIKIDGTNKGIIINDGTDDRILIGFQSGGF